MLSTNEICIECACCNDSYMYGLMLLIIRKIYNISNHLKVTDIGTFTLSIKFLENQLRKHLDPAAHDLTGCFRFST